MVRVVLVLQQDLEDAGRPPELPGPLQAQLSCNSLCAGGEAQGRATCPMGHVKARRAEGAAGQAGCVGASLVRPFSSTLRLGVGSWEVGHLTRHFSGHTPHSPGEHSRATQLCRVTCCFFQLFVLSDP